MRPPLGRRQQPRLIAARPGRLPRGCACCAAPALRAAACAPPCRGRPAPVTRGLVRPPPPRCAPALRRGGGSVPPAARAVAAHLRGNLFSALWAPPAAVCGRACACPCGPPGSPPAASNRRPGAAGPPLLARRAAARRCAAALLALVPPAPPLERGIAALLTACRWRRLLGFFAPPGFARAPPRRGGSGMEEVANSHDGKQPGHRNQQGNEAASSKATGENGCEPHFCCAKVAPAYQRRPPSTSASA